MKKVVLRGDQNVDIIEVPDPVPRGSWVVVKIHAAPLCTEWKRYKAGGKSEFLGHEAAGEVAAVDGPGIFSMGDRVVVMPQFSCGQCALCAAGDFIHCEHELDFAALHGTSEGKATLAQYLLKPSWLLQPIPPHVSYVKASLACCGLGPSFGALKAMRVQQGETLLITGAGPVGLGGIANALFLGVRPIVVEPGSWRAERALQMGASAVFHPDDDDLIERIRSLTNGRGVDCAMDCSGTVEGERLCVEAVRRKGRVAFIGECGDRLVLRASPDLIRKGITIAGVWHYNLNDYREVMRVIEESPVLDLLISHVLPMTQVKRALDLAATGASAKIILKPWD